jgi:hypothetical protein
MKFTNNKFSAEFTIPEQLTVRQHLRYSSLVAGSDKEDLAERYFDGAKILVVDWECPKLPRLDDVNFEQPLNAELSALVADIIIWVSMEVRAHINALDNIPKA